MSYKHLKIGSKAPALVNVIIEIPKGSHNKYEYDEKLDKIKLDRVLFSPVYYPADYGYVPETRSEDGDHLDILVIVSEPTFPGCIMEARPIGALKMTDDKGIDEKIIAVCDRDPRFKSVSSIEDIDSHIKDEIQHFFEVYKHLEQKKVVIEGWVGKDEAYLLINCARARKT
jgi:inorganic pyrophosphatase